MPTKLPTLIFIILLTQFSTFADLQNSKTYKVGLPNVPGLMERDKYGNPKGFPLEIFAAAAKDEGIAFKWVDGSWNDLFNKIKSGEIDVLPGTQVTESREEFLDFLDIPLYTMWSTLYIRDDVDFSNLGILKNKKIGIIKGGNNSNGFLTFINDFNITFDTVLFDSHAVAFEALRNNEIFAVPGPTLNTGTEKDDGIKSSGLFFNPTNINISFPKGKHSDLVIKINSRLKKYLEDPNSSYNTLYQKYRISEFKPTEKSVPTWLKTLMLVAILFLIIGILFVVLLKQQLGKKVKQLLSNERRNAMAMEIGELGYWEWIISTDTFIPSDQLIDIYTKSSKRCGFKGTSHSETANYARDEIIKCIKGHMLSFDKDKFSIERFTPTKFSSYEIWHYLIGAISERDHHGAPLRIIGYYQDITEKILKDNQLQQMHKMEAIGQLAGGVAHDFNNMLTGIINGAELLNRHCINDLKATELIEMILSAGERAADLTAQLLSFSRKSPVAPAVIDTHDSILNSIELLIHTIDKRITIHTNLSAENKYIVCDAAQLQGVFMNLCINASHAMPEGGEIKINTKNTELDSAYCKSSIFNISEGSYIQIGISDEGIGIAPDILSRIFEPFFTTKKIGNGTGLGLAAVYGTIQQNHGSITVTSTKNVGTTFTILLPLANEATQPLPQQKSGTSILGTGSILIVDDEEILRKSTKAILNEFGYDVIVAENGREALEIYSKKMNEIDIVMLDMIMPVMNGYDCFLALKKLNPNITVILSTGFSANETIQKMKESGVAGFIKKPYKGSELISTINTIRGSHLSQINSGNDKDTHTS